MWQRILLTPFFVLALLLCADTSGGVPSDVPAGSSGNPSPRQLEQRILDGMARGTQVAPLIEQWLEVATAPATNQPPRALSQAGAELRQSLAALESRLLSKSATGPDLRRIYDSARGADLLMREYFRDVAEKLAEMGVGGEVAARLVAAEKTYLDRVEEALGALAPIAQGRSATQGQRTATAELLGQLLDTPAQTILRAQVLPYRQASTAARPPRREPVVTPSYADALAGPSTAADLASTDQAPLSEEILALASELGHDYVRIHEWVQNEVQHQWYAGAMKGAGGTLRERAGNSVDQASLLIALLRASQLPCRYVHGVVELSVESVAAEMGLSEPSRVPLALARAGVAHAPVVRGGRVAAVDIEATWVVAHLPYSNYRGAVVDFSGRTWLPLQPAFKTYQHQAATGVLRQMSLDIDAKIDQHLSSVGSLDLLADLRSEVEAHLIASQSPATYEEQLGSRSIVARHLGLVPNTLNVTVKTVTGEAPTLAGAEIVQVRFRLRSAAEATSPVILEGELPLASLAGRRLTLSYLPATVDDHTTVNAFGGLSGVPLYLVRVRPQIKVDGRQALVGEGEMDLGVAHRVEIDIAGPAGTERIEQTVTSGTYQALGFGVQGLPRQVPDEGDLADTEGQAAAVLSHVALSFSERWRAGEDELAELLDLTLLRPLPSLAIATSAVAVEEVAGLPFLLRFQGVTLDAALRLAEPVTRGADAAAARDFLRLSALYGSSLEHRFFESDFLVESISADKGLALARQAGTEVLRFDADPLDARLADLAHPEPVRENIVNWLRLGMTVEVPAAPLTYNAWSGSTWRVEDPATGGAAYLISGGLAGGATSQPPTNWLQASLGELLESPYTTEPTPDPLAGAAIEKVAVSDSQVGVVGEKLPFSLAVKVIDSAGLPVEKAAVTFEGLIGDGRFLGEEEEELLSLTVETNRAGIAQAPFRLGQDTGDEPIYLPADRARGEKNATQALLHWVMARVETRDGVLGLAEPIRAIGRPGAPAALRRTDSEFVEFSGGVAGKWVDTITMSVDDEFGNPISNVAVEFSSGEAQLFADCDNDAGLFRPSEVFVPNFNFGQPNACDFLDPGLGDCGGLQQLTRLTSPFGASAGFIMGNDIAAAYPLDVSSLDFEAQRFTYSPFFVTVGGECFLAEADVLLESSSSLSFEGVSYNAARPGEEFGLPVQMTLSYWLPDLVLIPSDNPEFPLRVSKVVRTGEWRRTEGTVAFSASNEASVTPALFLGEGVYETLVTTGPELGLNTIFAEANDVLATHWIHFVEFDESGNVTRDEFGQETIVLDGPYGDRMTDVWGVLPQITAIEPQPLVLNEHSRTAGSSFLDYQILPAQYQARDAWAEIQESVFGDVQGRGVGTSRAGEGEVQIPPSVLFDVEQDYEAQLVLNPGTQAEVRSDKVEMALTQSIIHRVGSSDSFSKGVTKGVFVSREVDVLNQRVCNSGTEFLYDLLQEARVTLTFKQIDAINTDGSNVLGIETVLIRDQVKDKGEHRLLITPSDLLAGDYVYELKVVATRNGEEEVVQGVARSEYRIRDTLPIGHTLVQGVDLFDGHLALTREDFKIPGRGVPLSFRRTYSSTGPSEPGPLGAGWSHNFDSHIAVTPCNEVVISGGEGSGLRFVDNGAGSLTPLKGHHGVLRATGVEEGDYSTTETFEFFSRGGNRYLYIRDGENKWILKGVEDPNGNKTIFFYSGMPDEMKLTRVVDTSGRALNFKTQRRGFAFWDADVITQINGPGGIQMNFEYDRFGNLTRAFREAIAEETYSYESAAGSALEARHLLTKSVDLASGATTTYDYSFGPIGVQGDVKVPGFYVEKVTLPEGGESQFVFDKEARNGRFAELRTEVIDSRGQSTTYIQNSYGATLSILDAEGHLSTSDWDLSRVLLSSTTDANGVTSSYTHDNHGNVLSETVTGRAGTVTSSATFFAVSTLRPIRDLVASRTDRNGNTTFFDYDDGGNLLEERIEVADIDGEMVTLTTTHTYAENGDRLSTTNPRGHTTFFSYDVHGNLAGVTDPLGGTRVMEYDVRGRALSSSDALGRTTTFEYDALGRMTRRVLPSVDFKPAVEQVIYDDGARTRTRVDAEGRREVTEMDRQGRIVRMTNAVGATKVFEYDTENNKTLDSSWFDNFTPRYDVSYVYDGLNRLERRTEPQGRVTTYEYDPVGNLLVETLVSESDADFAPRVTETDYDDLNRPVEVRRRLGGGFVTRLMRYDDVGNVIAETDPLSRETHHTYDARYRLLQTVEPEWREGHPRITQNVYDGVGNVVETRLLGDPEAQVRRTEYDALNRATVAFDALGNRSSVEYDAVGNRVREIDALLNTTVHEYDERNRLTKTIVQLNRVTEPARFVETRFVYDEVGNLLEERQANGNVIRHTYDDLDRLISTTDQLGQVLQRGYDAQNRLVFEADAKGNATTFMWDDLDRLVQQTLPENRTEFFVYDPAGNLVAETNARGFTTTSVYDELDRLLEVIEPEPFAKSTLATYDLVGNLLSQTNRRGQTTTFEYDGLNRMVKRLEPALEDGTVLATELAYDAAGNLLNQLDRRGIFTEHTYDLENRRTRMVRAGVELASFDYDANGNLVLQTDANGNVTSFEYDERNLVVATNQPLASIIRVEYDDMGDVVRVRDPEGRIITRAFDLRRRSISQTLAAETSRPETTTFEYDLNSNRTRMQRPAGGAWTFTYDGADRLETVTDPEQGHTSYTWDKNGNIRSRTDGNSNTTTMVYDELDRPTEKEYADGEVEILSYDDNGNLSQRVDALGRMTVFGYDALDRQTDVAFPDDPGVADFLQAIAQVYDENNNLLEVQETFAQSGEQVTRRTYDAFDRLETVTDRWGNTLRHTYDANGNRTRLTDPSGSSTSYTFDELNRLSTVTTSAGVAEYDYYRDSRTRTVTYPNGTQASYGYDNAGRILTVNNRHNSALVSRFEYTYDVNGNRSTQVEQHSGQDAETTTYDYDFADRLREVLYPEKTTTYTYDGAGNRRSERERDPFGVLLKDNVYSYNARNQLETMANQLAPSLSVAYGYDANGNRTSRSQDGEVTDFSFDILDRMVQVAKDGQSLGTYRYDAQGLRVEKLTAEGSARYVYDQSSVLTRTDAAGITKFEYGPDRLLSVAHPSEGRAFYLFDALGSVSNLTTEAGTLKARYKYDAWGNYREVTGTSANPFGFTGHEHDGETGLIYAKARFYDPEVGLFLSEDPADGDLTNPPSLHSYLYAFQNPTVFVDPDGRTAIGNAIEDRLKAGGIDNAAELAGQVQDEFGTVAGAAAGVVLGILGAAADATAGVVGVVDTAVNAVVAGVAPDSSLGQAAAEELNDTISSTKETVKLIVENRREIGAAIVDGVVETAKGVARGDARAITRATAALATLVTPGGKTKGIKDAAGAVASRVARSAVASRVARSAGRAKERVKRNALRATTKVTRRGKSAVASAARGARAVGAQVKVVAKKIAAKLRKKQCFVAGTLVATEDGLRPIEELAAKEEVWARNEETGETRLQEIVRVFETADQVVYDVEVEAEDGTVESLGVTAEHPFNVVGKGWIGAAHLTAGDELVPLVDGWLRVRQVRRLSERQTVYNFEVAVDHTYFVGASGVWVHNECLREKVLGNIAESRSARNTSEFLRHAAQDRDIQQFSSLGKRRIIADLIPGRSELLLPVAVSDGKTLVLLHTFEPKGRGSKFVDSRTGRFLKVPDKADVLPNGSLKATLEDTSGNLERSRLAQKMRKDIEDSATATNLVEALELIIRSKERNRKIQ